MERPFLDPEARNPITLPDGSVHMQTVHLNQVIDHPNIEIGDHTYYSDFDEISDYAARLAPYLYPGAPERLLIGKFVQIAHGVRFITGSAYHSAAGYSNYPFAAFNPDLMQSAYADEVLQRGDTIVGNDVWIGFEAAIMAGVTIGDGAVIAARSVVTHDVPAYGVVAGNPDRLIKRRFDDETIARLLACRWWDWSLDKIERHRKMLESGNPALFESLQSE